MAIYATPFIAIYTNEIIAVQSMQMQISYGNLCNSNGCIVIYAMQSVVRPRANLVATLGAKLGAGGATLVIKWLQDMVADIREGEMIS